MKSLPTGTAKMLREVGKTPAWWQWKRALLGRCVHPVGLRAAGGCHPRVSARVLRDRCALDLSPPGAAGSGRLLLSPVCPSPLALGRLRGSQVSGRQTRADPHHQPPWPRLADGTSSDLSASVST